MQDTLEFHPSFKDGATYGVRLNFGKLPIELRALLFLTVGFHSNNLPNFGLGADLN